MMCACVKGTDRHAVEETEPHGRPAFGMMTGRAYGAKRIAHRATEYSVDRGRHGSGRAPCGLDGARGHHGIAIDLHECARTDFEREKPVHQAVIMCPNQISPVCQGRFAPGQRAKFISLQRGKNGGQALDPFGVARRRHMAKAIGVGEQAC
jgi:hypothetical protein